MCLSSNKEESYNFANTRDTSFNDKVGVETLIYKTLVMFDHSKKYTKCSIQKTKKYTTFYRSQDVVYWVSHVRSKYGPPFEDIMNKNSLKKYSNFFLIFLVFLKSVVHTNYKYLVQ